MSDELFQLSNGRYITSEDISRKLYYIKDHHPETAYQDDSTGYSWDEAGMADLFSECYQNDTRYCPEAKSWYTYETGKWHKDVRFWFLQKLKSSCDSWLCTAEKLPMRKSASSIWLLWERWVTAVSVTVL